MRYIEAIEEFRGYGSEKKVFLAGGITNCPDWQQEMKELLSGTDLTLFNPRRADFPIGEPGVEYEQVTWEHEALRVADAILFWFPQETICPIVLYELGAWSMMEKPIFVGIHPEYQRRQNVEIQTGLVRPDVVVVSSLLELSSQVSSLR